MREFLPVSREKRWDYSDLLLLADPEEKAIGRYLDAGDMYVLRQDGRDVCEAVVLAGPDGECELMNLATLPDAQGKGYGGDMVRFLMARYAGKYDVMLVGTSEGGVSFYRRLGFKPAFVRKDFFIENYDRPVVENGTRLRDMYCLKARLKG